MKHPRSRADRREVDRLNSGDFFAKTHDDEKRCEFSVVVECELPDDVGPNGIRFAMVNILGGLSEQSKRFMADPAIRFDKPEILE